MYGIVPTTVPIWVTSNVTTRGNFSAQAGLAAVSGLGLDGFKGIGGSMIFEQPDLSDLRVSFWSVLVPVVVDLSATGVPPITIATYLDRTVQADDLDKELEQRGLPFVRYADDCAPRRRRKGGRNGLLTAAVLHKR